LASEEGVAQLLQSGQATLEFARVSAIAVTNTFLELIQTLGFPLDQLGAFGFGAAANGPQESGLSLGGALDAQGAGDRRVTLAGVSQLQDPLVEI
jgi:hypothetical protein